ncbi:3772_t:CDS:2, partial [Acaulospora colombiana]
SIEDEFQALTSEFDGLMRVMNFTIAVQNQIQMKEDQKILRHDISEMRKYLKEIEGGIVNSMSEINSTLEDITQLNLAWQNKLLNQDQGVIKSATISLEELHDPLVAVRRGKRVFKKIRLGEQVAIKEKILKENEKKFMNDIISQVVILKKLKESTYILKFFGIAQDANAMYMVTEWCELGNLQEYYQNNIMDWCQRAQFAVDIARGLTFLHAVSILHHDIRSENVLITEYRQAKIANFSLSRGANDPTKDIRPTIDNVRWMAPEKLENHENKYNTKCEIYSFGMLLWEISEGQIPFAEEQDLLVIRKLVVEQKRRPPFSSNVPPEWSKISYQAMHDHPNARPALKDIFMILYSFHQKNQPQRSPRPSSNHIPSEDELPGVDDDLGIDDLTMSVKEAIAEHKRRDGDKERVWEAFKMHAEEFGDMTARLAALQGQPKALEMCKKKGISLADTDS